MSIYAPIAENYWDFPKKLEPLFLPKRYKVAYGGRGGAKSWNFARALLIKGWKSKLRILCAREIQKSIKSSVHQLLVDQIGLLGLGGFYDVFENKIVGRNGTSFSFIGLSNETAESMKSYEGVDICWVEEANTVSRRSWNFLIPTIRKPGSEIWVSFNPELDTDDAWQRFVVSPPVDSVIIQINYKDNKWFPEVLEQERQEMLRQIKLGTATRAEYDTIWEGKCKPALEGAIYFDELAKVKEEGRIRSIPYDPMLKVHTVWDLGWGDKMAILLVQRSTSEIRIIDYIEDSHKTLEHYVIELKKAGPDFNWGTDWLPHDGYHGNYHTGKTTAEMLTALGRNVSPAPGVPNIGIENGIKAARMIFPRVYFSEKAMPLYNRLARYRRHIVKATNTATTPIHDDNSNGADGFRYLAIVADQLTNEATEIIADPYAAFRG